MRHTVTATALSALLLSHTAFAAKDPEYGGFVGVSGAYIETDDVDESGTAFRVVIGPNITENLALEFGFIDLGEMNFDDPGVTYTDDENDAPTFVDAENGTTERRVGTETESGKTTYVGTESFHAQGILLNLRYNIGLTDTLDLFFKGGANAWMADVEKVRIIADNGTKSTTRSSAGSNETSGVELITGVGLMWEPLTNIVVRAEIESTSLDSFYIQPSGFMLYGLGIQYEF